MIVIVALNCDLIEQGPYVTARNNDGNWVEEWTDYRVDSLIKNELDMNNERCLPTTILNSLILF